jgi:hypothetical protein
MQRHAVDAVLNPAEIQDGAVRADPGNEAAVHDDRRSADIGNQVFVGIRIVNHGFGADESGNHFHRQVGCRGVCRENSS